MIHTRDLACRFADGRTLRFADVDVPQGGTLLLRGPSGSGKSTWLALAAGLLSAMGGEMVVAGHNLAALKAGSGESLNVKGAYLEVWADMLDCWMRGETAREVIVLGKAKIENVPVNEGIVPFDANQPSRDAGVG